MKNHFVLTKEARLKLPIGSGYRYARCINDESLAGKEKVEIVVRLYLSRLSALSSLFFQIGFMRPEPSVTVQAKPEKATVVIGYTSPVRRLCPIVDNR